MDMIDKNMLSMNFKIMIQMLGIYVIMDMYHVHNVLMIIIVSQAVVIQLVFYGIFQRKQRK